MKLKANKLIAVLLMLTAVLFTGCGDKRSANDEGDFTRSVITAAEPTETEKAETSATTTSQTTTTASKTTKSPKTSKSKKTTTTKTETTKKKEKKNKKKKKTTTSAETVTEEVTEETSAEEVTAEYKNVRFRNKKLLNSHYEKHGIEMGFSSAEEYEKAACAVVNAPDVLHKTEKEDGDDVYYLESTNEFVVVSKDGYLRTYFNPAKGKAYYDKQ